MRGEFLLPRPPRCGGLGTTLHLSISAALLLHRKAERSAPLRGGGQRPSADEWIDVEADGDGYAFLFLFLKKEAAKNKKTPKSLIERMKKWSAFNFLVTSTFSLRFDIVEAETIKKR